MRPRFWILLSIIFLTGCGSATSDETQAKQGILPGKVYEDVKCKENPTISYAIYLPSTYIPGDSLPLFLAFDPSGAGIRPVALYKDVAEQYRFILIGSNNSRNGQSADQTQQILIALLREIENRYSFDPDRIYCTGFSGGSRVSSMIAFYGGGVKGVIGCGAGLPSTSTPIQYRTDYYGIVGDQDFNYLEMVALAFEFSNQNIRSSLRIFHGPHDWPPAKEFADAVRWHWFNAMKDGLFPKDQTLEVEVQKETAEDLSILKAIDLSSLEREREQQRFYSESMRTKSLGWWKKELAKLEHPDNLSDSLPNKRLLSYLSIMAYTFSNQALSAKNRDQLAKMVGIYEIVDPENHYISYLKEQLNLLP
ncbi:hypothetical protein ACFLS7_05400 [Bacteroidota bacterium]